MANEIEAIDEQEKLRIFAEAPQSEIFSFVQKHPELAFQLFFKEKEDGKYEIDFRGVDEKLLGLAHFDAFTEKFPYAKINGTLGGRGIKMGFHKPGYFRNGSYLRIFSGDTIEGFTADQLTEEEKKSLEPVEADWKAWKSQADEINKSYQEEVEILEAFFQNPGKELEAIEKIQGGFAEKIKGTANILGIDPNLMLATIDKESSFRGYVTRREPHVVKRSLRKEYSREDAEIMGTSYGYFQILGEGFKTMGYNTPQEFKAAVTGDLSSQLKVYARYVRTKPGMLTALKSKDFQRIAYLYNGAGYAQNNYDNDLRAKYRRFSKAA
ncbi:N-acetylmuramidase family protein [Candidatus Gracilibacteria bacterium]|nr:N-acetylmuramidase family protein [Candidatus Gracilibacteria bacterium]MCF7819525.1 N-acetylmuramidase family protein [Candidatus Gracilibacteria bacterium]